MGDVLVWVLIVAAAAMGAVALLALVASLRSLRAQLTRGEPHED